MSYQNLVRICRSRIWAPSFARSPGNVWIVRGASQTSGSDTPSKVQPPKAPPKQPKKDVTKASAPPAEPEKGDTYKAGESYYSFNPFSFYDLDRAMESHRLPQPDSVKRRL